MILCMPGPRVCASLLERQAQWPACGEVRREVAVKEPLPERSGTHDMVIVLPGLSRSVTTMSRRASA